MPEIVDISHLLAESIELQQSMSSLQRQVTMGLTRMNHVVEMIARLSLSTTSSKKTSEEVLPGPIRNTEENSYIPPALPLRLAGINTNTVLQQSIVSLQRGAKSQSRGTSNLSLDQVKQMSSGIRWDESDYKQDFEEEVKIQVESADEESNGRSAHPLGPPQVFFRSLLRMRRNEGQSQSSGLDSGAKSMQFLSVLGPTSSSKQSQKPGVSGRFIVTTASDTASVVSDEPKADSLQSAKISRSKSTSLSASKKALEVSRSRGMSMDSSQPPLPTASLPKPTRKRGGLQDVVQSLLDAKKATEDKKRTENVEETESSTDSSICANASTESITNTNPDQPDTANTKPNNPEVSITVTKPELSAAKRRARELWGKLRDAVLDSPDFVEGLAPAPKNDQCITALPSALVLKSEQTKYVKQARKKSVFGQIPKKHVSTIARMFLYPAFNQKGNFIPKERRELEPGDTTRFFKSGIHPMSLFSVIVSSAMLGVYGFALFYEPFRSSYARDTTLESEITYTYTISILLSFDTIINIITPLHPHKFDLSSQGRRLSLSKWAIKYIKRNILIDFVSLIPIRQILHSYPEILYPLSFLRLARLIRLRKMLAHNGMCRKIGYHIENLGGIGSVMSRIIPICGLLIVFMHLQACSLYYVSSLQKFSTWNNQFDHWRNFEGGIEAANRSEAYTWMLIQAVGNMFAMNFKPQTIPEQVLNIIFIVCGGALYALLVGLLSSAVIAYDSSGRLYRQKLDELNEYMTWKRIDVPTKKKVLSYYEFKYRGKYFEEQNLLADMNGSLRMELATINCKRLIEKVPFLNRDMKDGRDSIYIGKIAMALTAMYYITGDFVFHQGEIGAGMYFIHSGMVNIIVSGKQVATAKEGSFFGEVALIANIPRTASIQAACACTLYSLSAVDFTTIINEFEDMKERMELIYEERMERVKREAEAKKAIN